MTHKQNSVAKVLMQAAYDLFERGWDDEGWERIHRLHQLPSDEAFEACVEWSGSELPLRRDVAAAVLGRLGFPSRQVYGDRSIPILRRLLDDDVPEVVSSALAALRFHGLNYPEVVDTIILARLDLKRHPNAQVREALAWVLPGCSLPGFSNRRAVRALIFLSADENDDVRDWATFGLAEQIESNTKAVRQALHARLDEAEPSTRGHALVGLAARKDMTVLPALIRELDSGLPCDGAIQAAALLAVADLVLPLMRLRKRRGDPQGTIGAAIEACQAGR